MSWVRLGKIMGWVGLGFVNWTHERVCFRARVEVIKGRSCVTTLGKLFATCLCSPSSINWYRPRVGTPCGWEGNRGPSGKQ